MEHVQEALGVLDVNVEALQMSLLQMKEAISQVLKASNTSRDPPGQETIH